MTVAILKKSSVATSMIKMDMSLLSTLLGILKDITLNEVTDFQTSSKVAVQKYLWHM